VPAVRLAVDAAGRDPGVVGGRVARAHLEDVGDVQPQQQLHARLLRDDEVADVPQLVPRAGVAGVGLGEGGVPADRLARVAQRLADRRIARRVERDHLLDAHGLALAHVERQDLLDVVLHLVQRPLGVERLVAAEHRASGRPRRCRCSTAASAPSPR
jgi:hypothetical protein